MADYTKGLYRGNNPTPVPSTIHDAKNSSLQDATTYIARNPQYFEPQRSNTFKFVVSDLSDINLNSFGITNGIPLNGGNAATTLELAVKASSVPHFDIDKLTINRGNNQMHFAGKPTFKDGQITVHDYIGTYVKDILLAWQRQAYDVTTGKVGLAADYKRTATLYELTPDYQIIREWKLYGCWVSSLSEGNYDHDSSDARTIDATIVYDYAEPQIYKDF